MKKPDIPAINRILKRHYLMRHAPVIELLKAQTTDPFKILVATILSARTKDETTSAASLRLFKTVRNFNDLDRVSQEQLEKMIFPVGFYRVKAKHLKQLPGVLREQFNGVIPDNIEALCKLPGVGRKTANLVVSVAFDKPAICVDVHVHRICNRMGLVETDTPLETEMELRRILPVRYWKTWNRQLVSFGQTVCAPRRPACGVCALRPHCARIGVS